MKYNVPTNEDLTISVKDVTEREINVYTNIRQSFGVDSKLNNGLYFPDIENVAGTFKQVMKVIKAD